MHAHAVIYLCNRSQALQLALSVVRLPAAHYVTPSKPPAPVVHAAHAQGGCTCAVGSACACVYLRRRRQGLEAAGGDSGRGLSPSQGNALGVGLRVGVELVSALAVAVAIGWFLDKWLGTKPFLLMLFVVLGGGAGVANVWRLVAPPKPPPRRDVP